MRQGVLAADFTTEPYWSRGLPPFESSPPSGRHLDVAVIGGGFAGLSAALTLAQAGASVAVFEAGCIGAGNAARAAGSLSHVPKASLADLKSRYGHTQALAVYREARRAREFVEQLIRDNQIRCDLRTCTRFIAAHSARAHARQHASLDALRDSWGEVELVAPSEQRRFIGSDAFFGGIAIANIATLQPALLQRGLARAAQGAGARVLQNERVSDVRRIGRHFEVRTQNDAYRSDHVVLATNADTAIGPPSFRSLARRLIVVPAFAMATEELPIERVARVLPVNGPVSDTYKIINYMAPSNDGKRLVISARAGRSEGGLERKAALMLAYFADRFPDLAGVKISSCWSGRFTVTADWLPHTGVEDGVHYVLGCCGTGIPTSTFLGHKVAERILGRPTASHSFERPLPALPFLGAGERFLPLVVRAYALRDRLLR